MVVNFLNFGCKLKGPLTVFKRQMCQLNDLFVGSSDSCLFYIPMCVDATWPTEHHRVKAQAFSLKTPHANHSPLYIISTFQALAGFMSVQ